MKHFERPLNNIGDKIINEMRSLSNQLIEALFRTFLSNIHLILIKENLI